MLSEVGFGSHAAISALEVRSQRPLMALPSRARPAGKGEKRNSGVRQARLDRATRIRRAGVLMVPVVARQLPLSAGM